MSGNLPSKRRSFWSQAGLLFTWAVLSGIPRSPAGAEEACWVRGDVDGNGVVDLSDVVPMLNQILLESTCVTPAGDANDNGSITIADPLYLLHWQFGGGAAPPAPYPDCGVDPPSGRYGFGEPNPDYGILASVPTVEGNRVVYRLKYRSPADLLGLSLGWEFAPGSVLRQARLEPDFPNPADISRTAILPETPFRNQ